MKAHGPFPAMKRGAVIAFLSFSILYSLAALFQPLGEGVVGKMLGEFPVPWQLVDMATIFLFGSPFSEGGIVIYLALVCAELVLLGMSLGYLTYVLKKRFSRTGNPTGKHVLNP